MGTRPRPGVVQAMPLTVFITALTLATALLARAAVVATRSHGARRRALGAGAERDGGGAVGASGFLPEPPAPIGRALDRAGIEVAPQVVWSAWLGAMVGVTAVATAAGGVAVALLVLAMGAVAPAVALRARRHHGDQRLERELPGALEAVARSIRSGASLRQAIGEAALSTPGPLGREFAMVARQAAYGATLMEALEALGDRRPIAGVRLTVAALCLGVETGGAQARAVDGVATTLRDRFAVAAEVRALASQARVSALVIGLAPLAFGAFAVTTDPRTGEFLFHTPLGLALLAVGVTLDGLGWLWMQHLARGPA